MTNKGLSVWFFQRVSAAFLIIGLITHFVVLHFMIERPVTMEKVAERLKSPGFFAFDSVLLVICIYHALNGIYSIIVDFKPAKNFERAVLFLFWVGGIATSVVGIWTLIPFTR